MKKDMKKDIKISHRIIHSEISGGSIFLSKTDHVEEFFRQFENGFDLKSKWGDLYARTVCKFYIWMGFD